MRKRESPVGGDTPADPLVSATDVGEPDTASEPDGVFEPDAGSGPEAGSGPDEVSEPEPRVSAADPDVEVVDGFPVLAEVRTVERVVPASLPTVQVAAVAATGFVAGAATVALVRRRAARKVARNGRSGSRRAADLLPIVATRSFLVDVHVISKPE